MSSHQNRHAASDCVSFARLSFPWHATDIMKQNHVSPYRGNRFGWDCCFPNGQWGWKQGGGNPTLTLDLSISAVVEWLAFRDWGSVWSWSVKTYTPTERRKMKDIFSFSSTFPKVSGVHIGSKLQHLKHALWVSSESLCSFGFLRLYSPQGKISGVTYKWRFSAGFESWQHRTIFHF